jgi:hypothetical protein
MHQSARSNRSLPTPDFMVVHVGLVADDVVIRLHGGQDYTVPAAAVDLDSRFTAPAIRVTGPDGREVLCLPLTAEAAQQLTVLIYGPAPAPVPFHSGTCPECDAPLAPDSHCPACLALTKTWNNCLDDLQTTLSPLIWLWASRWAEQGLTVPDLVGALEMGLGLIREAQPGI